MASKFYTKKDLCRMYELTLAQLSKVLAPIKEDIGWKAVQQLFRPRDFDLIQEFLGPPVKAV